MEETIFQIAGNGIERITSNGLNTGIDKIVAYDNIAIVVLMVCLLFSFAFNIMQARWRNKDTREFLKRFLEVKDALTATAIALNSLNTRIDSHASDS